MKRSKKLLMTVASVTVIASLAVYATSGVYAQEDADLVCEPMSAEFVSDSETMVNGTSSVAVDNDAGTEGNQVPSAWTANIPGATWIWSDAQEDAAAATGTEVFTRSFEWSSDATTTAILDIATDNTYSVSINGEEVASSSNEINFTLETQDQIDVSDALVNGTNTIEITVTNLDNGSENPAGLLYSLELDGFDCEVPTEDQPTGEILEPDEGETVSGTTTLLATYDDGDEVNDDAVSWAVRSGTCAAGTGTVFGNVDGHSDSFSWDGMNFEAMIDTTEVMNGDYCFVFNPTDDSGEEDVRLTRNFVIDNEDEDGDEGDGDEGEAKVEICHIPRGNPSSAHTIVVAEASVANHMAHGDVEGSCEDADLEFEAQTKVKKNR